MALVRCILGKFLGVACHCFPPSLDVPTFHHQVPPRPPRRERSQRRKWELWARMLSGNFAEMTTSTTFRDLLHAANLRHGTDGFTSPPKEGVLRIFFALKNPTALAFEHANLGTKGQHAALRPPKPLFPPTRIQTPVRPARSVVTTPTDLSLLPIIKTGFGTIHYRFPSNLRITTKTHQLSISYVLQKL